MDINLDYFTRDDLLVLYRVINLHLDDFSPLAGDYLNQNTLEELDYAIDNSAD